MKKRWVRNLINMWVNLKQTVVTQTLIIIFNLARVKQTLDAEEDDLGKVF